MAYSTNQTHSLNLQLSNKISVSCVLEVTLDSRK